MALLTLRPPVNYEEQQAAFEDFLRTFKSTSADTEDALEDLRLDDEDLAEDYDMMDDALDGGNDEGRSQQRRGASRRSPKLKYMKILQDVADRTRTQVLINLDDLDELTSVEKYEKRLDEENIHFNLVSSIEKNAYHYIEIFSRAIDKVMPQSTQEPTFKDDVIDIIMSQRSKRNETIQEASEQGATLDVPDSIFPPELTRRYNLNIKPMTPSGSSSERNVKALAVRHVRGEHLGHLITVRGIATRVSDVKPAVQVNAYSCDRCNYEVFQPVTTKQFTPLTECPSDECKKNNAKGQLFLATRASKFLPFQEVKIQEMADQVPVGHIPRQLTVYCHGSLARQINPGDVVDIAGIFLPTPYTGFKAIRAGLLTDTYLEAQHVLQHKKAYDDIILAQPTIRRMDELERSGQLYEYLSRSIAPEIFGHLDVKKALLLQLIGGVTKEMGDGMRIRGDINICLMGDPGVAKSQLLKYMVKVAPRGVYTTGRGSSGVGLTAAVMRDPVTDEMVLEGGALVLADNGMCCIDEFDKMDDSDRTAIHEVMEQQTISISKAGITTTLNARTAILAAANPLYGRYNPRISPVENINLPAALLSRFDILFLILDTPSREADEALARHVTHVHIHNTHPGSGGDGNIGSANESNNAANNPSSSVPVFSPAEVRQYVSRALSYRPTLPPSVATYLTSAYVRLRAHALAAERANRAFAHTSPRTLLGVLRLAQALARLRFADTIVIEDVDEALRLVEVSKASLDSEGGRTGLDGSGAGGADRTASSRIYQMVRAMARSGAAAVDDGSRGQLDLRRVRERIIARGFREDEFWAAVREYALLDVWQTAADNTRLVFIETGQDNDMESDDE